MSSADGLINGSDSISPRQGVELEPYLAFEGMRTFVVDDCQAVDKLHPNRERLPLHLPLNNTSAENRVGCVDGLLAETQRTTAYVSCFGIQPSSRSETTPSTRAPFPRYLQWLNRAQQQSLRRLWQ